MLKGEVKVKVSFFIAILPPLAVVRRCHKGEGGGGTKGL